METLIGFGTTKKKVHVYKKKMWVAKPLETYFFVAYNNTFNKFIVGTEVLPVRVSKIVNEQVEKGNHYKTQSRAQTVADYLNRKFQKDILQVFKESHK